MAGGRPWGPAVYLGHIRPGQGLGSCLTVCGSCRLWLRLLRDTNLLLSLLYSNMHFHQLFCIDLSLASVWHLLLLFFNKNHRAHLLSAIYVACVQTVPDLTVVTLSTEN